MLQAIRHYAVYVPIVDVVVKCIFILPAAVHASNFYLYLAFNQTFSARGEANISFSRHNASVNVINHNSSLFQKIGDNRQTFDAVEAHE